MVTESAVAVGEEGGSVVDVAIVAALTAMCTEPGVCGPGGGGFLTVDLPGTQPLVIDGYMAYPGKGFEGETFTREVSMPYGGGITTVVDAGSIAVPGAFAALEAASARFGLAPWALLMEIVAETVDPGFPLSQACHLYLNEGAYAVFAADPVAREALFDGETPYPVGTAITLPGLSETLRQIGAEGARTFYEGELARTIVADLAERGGQITLQDLSEYRAEIRKPTMGNLRGWHLALNPPPSVGGTAVARVLEGAQGDDAAGLSRSLMTIFEERRSTALRSPSTISVAAADEDGGVVAASFSAGYVSGVIPEGTGMLMNNALGELELVTGPATPGERMISNMAPTVARRGSDAVAVGSPGADRITSAVATTLDRLTSGDSLQQSIDFPRVHPEFGDFGVRLAVEPGLDIPESEIPLRHFEAPHMYFGGVNGAGLMSGRLQAHADSRRTGSVGFTP